MAMKKQVSSTALVLFSGGLDSMLSCKVLEQQGINVVAVKFVTPFFGYDLLAREEEYQQEVWEKYRIRVLVRDVSRAYLTMLGNPAHGYGKNFNPCIDCKILLLSTARRMMDEVGADFLATGEVIGQRPMSQRRDTLWVIERDSGCQGLLLRPLCARNMAPTRAEEEGLVDRRQLLDFSGRGRQGQMALAKSFGITDYPSPAGGCTLTDKLLGGRIERFYQTHDQVTVDDARLLLVGRHFQLPAGGWLVLGRNEAENVRLLSLAGPDDWRLKNIQRPGPAAVVRFGSSAADLELAAQVVVRYSKKVEPPVATVECIRAKSRQLIEAMPLADGLLDALRG